MKELEIMERSKYLERELESLVKLEREQYKLQSSCKHLNIATEIFTNCYDVEAQCLFCRRKFENKRSLSDYMGRNVDLSDYKGYSFENKEQILLKAEEIYKEIVAQNEHLDLEEIAKIMASTFEERYCRRK